MDPVPGMIRNDLAKNRSFPTDGSVDRGTLNRLDWADKDSHDLSYESGRRYRLLVRSSSHSPSRAPENTSSANAGSRSMSHARLGTSPESASSSSVSVSSTTKR